MNDSVSGRGRAWPVWRGSQELLLHVVRLAAQKVSYYSGAPASIVVSVQVGKDAEVFKTLDDFRGLVSPEALRKFDRIVVWIGESPGPRITVYLAREGRVLPKGEAGVWVETVDPTVADALAQDVGAALGRGYTWTERLSRSGLGFLAMGVVITGLVRYALPWAFGTTETELPQGVQVLLPAGTFGLMYLAWYHVVPAVEIASPGKSRFERVRGAVIGLVAGLIAAGLARRIYGH